jgi:trehalose 6-phosphate phosphatase
MAMRPDPLPELLERLRARRAGSVVITDFDGTLAPIVADPAASRPLDEAVELLHRLAGVYGRVAVVSGRPAAFLLDRLAAGGGAGGDNRDRLVISGLYGLEFVRDGRIEVHPDAEPWRVAVTAAARAAREQAPAGVGVEPKGLSVALHVRTAPEHAAWVESWVTSHAAVSGLAVHPARMSWELRAPVRRDKGTVVTELAEGLSAACFMGDDVGDLPAFDALDRLDAAGVAVLKVGVRSEEAPVELLERADVVVDGPAGVVDLLRRLL